MKKTEKQFFVDNLAEELKHASSVVLVDYSGLSVKKQQELKKRLAEADATLSVVKNTLFKLAGEKAKVAQESLADSVLVGPSALIITRADPIAPLQVLSKFAQENEVPQFKVGIIEGSFQTKDELAKLSKLPSKSALAGQAVGTIAQPMYQIVGILQANLQNLLSVLKQASEK